LAWRRYFEKITGKPKMKGHRRKANSVPFPDPIARPVGNKIHVLGLGKIRIHKQFIPDGKIKCGSICRRASGWYLNIVIDATPKSIKHAGNGQLGIDPGYDTLLTFSTGEKIQHPRELEASEHRLKQAQRGNRGRLASRIREHAANQRRDRNHRLSKRIVAENAVIRFSKDNIQRLMALFGKNVASSCHGQLRQQLQYKSIASGRVYDEPDSNFSTMTCSTCGSRCGPRGLTGLKVRQWTCVECGSSHDRDVNAAINTLHAPGLDEPTRGTPTYRGEPSVISELSKRAS
jgi:putative transposase